MKVHVSNLRTFLSVFLDAIRRAIQGALFAILVPPAATFVIVALPHMYEQLTSGTLPIAENLLRSCAAGLAIAGMAFLMGAVMLIVFGVPVLFCLRVFRVDHPLVAAVAAACLTFWRFSVSPANGLPFSEDFSLLWIVAAITGYVAGMFARFHPTFEKDAPKAVHLSI
jgi:hypothetical protein